MKIKNFVDTFQSNIKLHVAQFRNAIFVPFRCHLRIYMCRNCRTMFLLSVMLLLVRLPTDNFGNDVILDGVMYDIIAASDLIFEAGAYKTLSDIIKILALKSFHDTICIFVHFLFYKTLNVHPLGNSWACEKS